MPPRVFAPVSARRHYSHSCPLGVLLTRQARAPRGGATCAVRLRAAEDAIGVDELSTGGEPQRADATGATGVRCSRRRSSRRPGWGTSRRRPGRRARRSRCPRRAFRRGRARVRGTRQGAGCRGRRLGRAARTARRQPAPANTAPDASNALAPTAPAVAAMPSPRHRRRAIPGITGKLPSPELGVPRGSQLAVLISAVRGTASPRFALDKRAPYVPIWRAWRLSSADVLCAPRSAEVRRRSAVLASPGWCSSSPRHRRPRL
jgi:hypothetical protein